MKKILSLLVVLCLFAGQSEAQKRKKKKKYWQEEPKGFVFIPMGSCTNNGNTVSVDAFWMMETEVSNALYKEFLTSLEQAGETDKLEIARVKTEMWNTYEKGGDDFANHYFQHESFADYPVVNVSYEAALLFCEWYTAKLQKDYPGEGFREVRLPSEDEWVYAARGDHDNALFSWGTNELRGDKGMYMCSYKHGGDENIRWDRIIKKNVLIEEGAKRHVKAWEFDTPILASVNSFFKNQYGLYNMCGNAAEVLAEKGKHKGGSWNSPGYNVRIEAEDMYEGISEASPYIGFRVVVSYLGHN